jgi:predicted dehydrogenase
MSEPTNRREFLRNITVAGAGLAALGPAALQAANVPGPKPAGQTGASTRPTSATRPASRPAKAEHPLSFAVIGTSWTGKNPGRGTELALSLAALPGAVVRYVCDVDADHVRRSAAIVAEKQGIEPKAAGDFRRVLDDKSIDAVAIATPDHWHSPAAILACAAGKHVYVEKPCCHNPHEGELLVEAARKYNRVVQHGTQRRSWPKNVEAIERVKSGDIGRVLFSRGWYTNDRPETGRRTPAAVLSGLDWELWQGPAPRRPFTENVVHYKWHWYWNWGTGELGNNGIHALDVCRWGLGVDHPRRVTAGGGRYFFHDDQETPDTLSVTYDFGDKEIVWEGRSCLPRGIEGSQFGIAFYGDKGTIVIDGGGYKLFDPKGKQVESQSGPGGNGEHLQNFIDCIESGKRPNAPIDEGFKSVLLCHLGNIAWRTGRVINCDPQTGQIHGDPEAAGLWRREYEKGWEPKV